MAGDGKTVLFGLQNEREWASFCRQVLQRPDLVDDPAYDTNAKRSAHRADLKALIESLFRPLSAAQVIERLDAAGIGNAAVNAIADVWAHPQLTARDRWTEVSTPAGPMPALKPPASSDSFSHAMGAVPALGEHTEAVLSELGCDADEQARLKSMKAI